MNAYIISIGNELLNGNTLDTNSTWIGKQLDELNIDVIEKITISDNKEDIKFSIKNILKRTIDYVFITGGLGPTHDDVTKLAIKNILNSDEYFDEEYYKELKFKFKNRGLKISENNKSQAIILKDCKTIKNSIGTALGMEFQFNNSKVFVMPGVPIEMKIMMKEIILPAYFTRNKQVKNNLTILTSGSPEGTIAEKIKDLISNYSKDIKIAFLPSYSGVNIRLSLVDKSGKDKKLFELEKKINQRLGKIIYGYNDEKLEEVVGKLLIENKLTIAIAESCTGGLISQKITNVPGSSNYFIGSIVAYNNRIKEKKLNISKNIINKFGAVSKEVVMAMASGIKNEFKSDIGFSISGISGPNGGSENKAIGLVHMALRTNNTFIHKKFSLIPERDIHRNVSSQIALNIIRLFLLNTKDDS